LEVAVAVPTVSVESWIFAEESVAVIWAELV